MFCPLSNSTVELCNRALSALFTVSLGVIADIRGIFDQLCEDPSLEDRPLLENGTSSHYKNPMHPMNRFSYEIRDRIENHLNIVLRADPAGAADLNVCRVYSPDVNTQEKLRRLVTKILGEDEAGDVQMSDSTMQRIIGNYLGARDLRIVFKQTDHNACPNCKSLQYAILQFHHKGKESQANSPA